MALLNEEQKKQISEAVAVVEDKTAGEIVVVVAGKSDDYSFRRALLSLILALGIAHEVSIAWPHLPLWGLLVSIFAFFNIFYALLGLAPLLRLVIPRSVKAERVQERALRAFMESGVTETRDRSGVLIYLSEAEHRAIILADKGINDRVDPSEWQKDVDALVLAIRDGEPTQGLLHAIARIGEVLSSTFPARNDDTNELCNEVREI